MTLTLDLHLPPWTHVEGDAEFSPDRAYRWWLTRRWGPGPALMFVSLNPSDADEHRDDQTTRRDMRFARDFGYDAVTLLNLSAAVMTNPKHLAGLADPIGPENDAHLDREAARHDVIVFAWGANADPARARVVATRLWRICLRTGAAVAHLGWTAEGQPRHPSRLAKSTPLSTLTASAHLNFSDVDPPVVQLLSDPSGAGEVLAGQGVAVSAPSITDPVAVAIAERVVALLADRVYRATERQLQDGIEIVLGGSGFRVEREFRLSERDRPDFLVEGCVAVEVKMRASGSAVLSQLARYANHRRVKAIVVATPRLSSLAGMPAEILGVPVRGAALPGPGLTL